MKREKNTEKYEAIIDSAQKCFLEKGFEGTSVRNITDDAGVATGLFYHYFKTKAEVFDSVVLRFLNSYRPRLQSIVYEAQNEPYQGLTELYSVFTEMVSDFREQYRGNMHISIKLAVREYALDMLEEYVRQILKNAGDNGSTFEISTDVLAIMLSHGIGSIVIHEDRTFTDKLLPEAREAIIQMMGLSNKRIGEIHGETLKK